MFFKTPEEGKITFPESITLKSKSNYTFDPGFCISFATTFLLCIGLISIYAASSIKAQQLVADPLFFVKKQAVFGLVGVTMVLLAKYIPINWLERFPLPLTLISLILLLLIFVPGVYKNVNAAYRWINIGPLRYQPAELSKLALIFFLAKNLSRPNCNLQSFKIGILPNLVVLSTFVFLLMLQPDFGTSALLGLVTLGMLFCAGVPFRFITYFTGASAVGLVIAILIAPYRMARLVAFIDPWSKFKTGGFQIIQSYLGFQNGGLLGVGLGASKQKLFFLPEAHTDFILAVVGEELGLLGVLLVVFLLFYITFIGFYIAKNQSTPFRRYLAFGLAFLISSQALFNMGVTMGLLPTKGIPLPFVSSGISSLTTFLFSVGVLYRLSHEIKAPH